MTYDIGLLRQKYLTGHIDLDTFENQVADVLSGRLHLHDHEWVDITSYGHPHQTLICWKCAQEKAA